MVTWASKNTAYWQLLSGRSILCSLEPLACEWNFPAVHKNTGTTSRAHLRSLEKLEVGDISRQHISAIWSEWLSLNACCPGVIRINCREDCVWHFHQIQLLLSPFRLLFLHMFFCVQGFAMSTWIWLRKCGGTLTVIFHTPPGLGKVACKCQGTRHKNNKIK